MPYQEEPALPSHIATRLPALELLEDALLDGPIEISAGCRFYRGAWNRASVWPGQVTRTYRFGPPDVLIGSDGRYPFHWVYAASHVITAAWEAQFVQTMRLGRGLSIFGRVLRMRSWRPCRSVNRSACST
jgi:hypothetical protein